MHKLAYVFASVLATCVVSISPFAAYASGHKQAAYTMLIFLIGVGAGWSGIKITKIVAEKLGWKI